MLRILSHLFGTALLIAGMLLLLSASRAVAETPLDFEDPLAGLAPMEDASLAESRGGAVLPNGMTIEVLGTMRLLVDGDELASGAASGAGDLTRDLATQISNTSRPGMIVNSLDNVSLEQYREINFFISNLPDDLTTPNFIPRPILPERAP
jgi:hypothetical protein